MRKRDRHLSISLALSVLCLLLFFTFNIKAYYYSCVAAVDFGIYQEALYKIASLQSFNPFISLRGYPIFGDHFDPILISVAPLVALTSFSVIGMLLLQNLWPILTLGFLYKKIVAPKTLLIAVGLFLLSPGLTGGLVHPIHPVTWSFFPAALTLYFFFKDKNTLGITSLIFLMSFKEVYAFVAIGISFALFLRKKNRAALTCFLIGLCYLIFLYTLRPKLFGPVYPYSARVLEPLIASPLEFFQQWPKSLHLKDFLKAWAPLFPFVYFLCTQQKKNALLFLAAVSPLVGIHLLSNMIHNWHTASFYGLAIGAMLASGYFTHLQKNRKTAVLVFGLFLMSSFKYYEKAVKLAVFDKSKTCEISPERRNSLGKVRKIIASLPPKQHIASTSGMIPWIMTPHSTYYNLGLYSSKTAPYSHLLIEKEKYGYNVPYSEKELSETVSSCINSGAQTLWNDKYIYLAKGPFRPECLEILKKNWVDNI